MKRFLMLAAGAAALALAGAADAASWLVDYTSLSGAPFEADLTVTASDTLNAAGGFDVLAVAGDVDGDTVAGLIANPSQPWASYSADGMFIFDNNIWPTGGGPVFSNPGLFFTGVSGNEYNLFSDNASTYELYKARSGVGYLANSVGTLGLTHLDTSRPNGGGAGAVPEPAVWGMMIVGFGAAGALLRRRRAMAVA